MTISPFGSLKPTSRLQAAFYLLLRDELPFGRLSDKIQEALATPFDELEMENPHFGQAAREWAEALTK
jgi:hypothetical protein